MCVSERENVCMSDRALIAVYKVAAIDIFLIYSSKAQTGIHLKSLDKVWCITVESTDIFLYSRDVCSYMAMMKTGHSSLNAMNTTDILLSQKHLYVLLIPNATRYTTFA